jgi:DNA repair protein RecO (recombination protein O)
MSTFEDEAIVLRQYSLSDSDRIVVFMTREYGKVRAVAKGAKKPQSRIAACLEPLSHIRLELYAREGRDLSQIRRTEIILSYLAEICNEIAQDNQGNQALFRLILACLNTGEKQGVSPQLLRYYEIWCLKLSGLLPNYAYCSNCGKCVKDEGFFAWSEAGQARCQDCSHGRGLKIGAVASSALMTMARLSPEQFVAQPYAEESIREIEQLSQKLLDFHLEKHLKSYRILKEAL